ncbi:MAG: pyrroline-5-carboxylate reductase [Clostridia bacterium]|nr:pyrroline-5-carboxylate reductase [Clostridia bacterium]MDR3644044.1 pyrroline-5-carboxylate reductase [Clostridia bacterium]
MPKKIGFIGAGNMTGAIIEGIFNKGVARAQDLTVCDKMPEKLTRFRAMGIGVAETIGGLAYSSQIIFLAVKPQDYETALAEIRDFLDDGKLIVTIAAGISSSFIKQKLGLECKIVRAMPNTPLLLGEGATALCQCPPVSDEEFEEVRHIFEAGGIVTTLPEDKMNAVISVNSTSPAYVYLLAKAVIDGAVGQGIDAETAKDLFCKTLIGSARMISESGRTPDELVKMVASPGGTTLRALEALEEHGFENAVHDAMLRCTQRAQELGR